MSGQMRNNAENKGVYKSGIFQEFVRWSALPHFERVKLGITDQGDFAKAYGINKDTITRWKQRPEFEGKVDTLQKSWGRDRTPDVAEAIYRSAIKGSARSQKLWLQYFTSMDPNKKPRQEEPLFQLEDIRYIIQNLPKDLQDKYNVFFRDLHIDAKAFEEGRFDDMSNSPNYNGL